MSTLPFQLTAEMWREMAEYFCGCCGNELADDDEAWCARCSPHVLHSGGPEWDRTWFAQTGRECPYQV